MVRISERQQRQSHWIIEDSLRELRKGFGDGWRIMNRTIPFTTDGKESPGSELGWSTQGDLHNNVEGPRLVACLLLVPEDAQAILLLRALNK